MPTDFRLTLDATRDSSLLSNEGLLRRLAESLDEVLNHEQELPRRLDAEVIYPDSRRATQLIKKVEALNNVIEGKGWLNKIAHQAFRSLSGIHGTLRPFEIHRSPADSAYFRLVMDLSGLSREDAHRFSAYLAENAHRVS